jgi:glycosyltransferase involved in cell wall biosynthesis
MEVAKRLKGQAEFRWVGAISLRPEAAAEMGQHVQLTGPVPRGEVTRHFEWADVLVLPSLCEGSATVTYEALACGLPVICTANTGSVVRDGAEGYIVAPRDINGLTARLEGLLKDPGLLASMRLSAGKRAQEHTLAEYGRRLLLALSRQ